MTSISSQAPSAEIRPGIRREVYAAFIAQIELLDIWLHEAKVINRYGPHPPKRGVFRFTSQVGWEARPGGFRAFDRAHVVLEAGDVEYAELEVTFGLDFASQEPLTADLFAVFGEVNLPVNTWPYLREFVSTTMGRMGWRPFTLPALKRGTASSSPPAVRRRRATKPRDRDQAES
jgi:hypothetical protein